MGKATQFLLRWLYVSNLIEDRVEIFNVAHPIYRHPRAEIAEERQEETEENPILALERETQWQRDALVGITMYPPGTPRLLALDALRLEITHKLARELSEADETIGRSSRARHPARAKGESDPEVISALREMEVPGVESKGGEKIGGARSLFSEVREYLPQVLAAILRSPVAVSPALDPVLALRNLLLLRCFSDPSLGIELCWLLEAEVGRAWKILFEHRQVTGRRLIVVLPAEKALVLGKIGNSKRLAFDLLQDVEQATAFGLCGGTPSLPAALSSKRCGHFGDSMYFVDSLAKISSNLRDVPCARRQVRCAEG